MRQRVFNQIGDVPIRQCVKQVRPLTPPRDQALGPEQAKSLRDGRELLAGGDDHFSNATFAVGQELKQSQSRPVTQRSENA